MLLLASNPIRNRSKFLQCVKRDKRGLEEYIAGTGETAVPMCISTFLPYDLLFFKNSLQENMYSSSYLFVQTNLEKEKAIGFIVIVADNNKYI